tara:strand:+ start:1480 stop:2556 length:1077 start_codon:yes stop_codon:yes gene_type:complete
MSVVYVSNKGGDAPFYYMASIRQIYPFNGYVGANLVVDLTAFFSRFLSLSYQQTTLIFSGFGYFGILIASNLIRSLSIDLGKKYKYLYMLMLYSPSCHFWTTLIGKDGLSFLSISLISYSLVTIRKGSTVKSIFFIFLSIFTLVCLRPHFAFIVASGIAISLFLILIRKTSKGLFALLLLLPISIVLLIKFGSFVQGSYGYNQLDLLGVLSKISEDFTVKADNTFQTTYIPILSEIKYIIAPLHNLGGGVISLLSVVETFPYFIFLGVPIIKSLFKSILKFKLKPINFIREQGIKSGLLISSFVFIVVLAATTYNLGVVIRQRTVISPILISSSLIVLRSIVKDKKYTINNHNHLISS